MALLLPLLLVGACNDDPGPLGSDYLPQNVIFRTYTLRSSDFQTASGVSSITNSSSDGAASILVGASDDGTVAHGLIGFTTEAAILNDGVNRPLTAVSLVLHNAGYSYGDTLSPRAAFDVVVLDEVFASNAKWNDALVLRIENAPVLATVDTVWRASDSLTIPLNIPATAKFLKEYYRWDTLGTVGGVVSREFHALKTLALRSRTGSRSIVSLRAISGIAENLRPGLKLQLGDTSSTLRVGVSNWIVKNDLPATINGIQVGGGLPMRALITFNLDSIPPTATIHQAELRLTRRPDGSRRGTGVDTSYLVAYVADQTSLNANTYLTTTQGALAVNRLAADSLHFSETFRITTLAPIMARWNRSIRGVDTLANMGLILAYNRYAGATLMEATTVDRIAFYGPDATDPSVRPTLTITYSIQADAKP